VVVLEQLLFVVAMKGPRRKGVAEFVAIDMKAFSKSNLTVFFKCFPAVLIVALG
jgi:hypothetical protein